MTQKLDNLFYLFLNQLDFRYADKEGLLFKCSCLDFLLIPDDINVTIEVYYELGTVMFSAYKGYEELEFFESVCSESFLIQDVNLVVFREWVNSIPKNP